MAIDFVSVGGYHSVADIVGQLSESGVYLYVEANELKFKAKKGAFAPQQKAAVKQNKAAIIEYLLSLQSSDAAQSADSNSQVIKRRGENDPVVLSFAQQRLWFVDQFGQGSTQYNTQSHFIFDGAIEPGAFAQALSLLLERHEVLRSCYVAVDDEVCQQVQNDFALPLSYHDLIAVVASQKAAQVQQLMQQDAAIPFDLSNDLMVRVCVVRLTTRQTLCFYTLHHIAGDGWSMGIFENELRQLYQACKTSQPNPLVPLNIQYGDYAIWQRNHLKGEVLERLQQHWHAQLKGLPQKHNLLLDKPRPEQQRFDGRFFEQRIDAATTAAIRRLCQSHNVTLFMFLQTAFALLLARHSGESDIVMGSAVAGRPNRDTEQLIGLFLNLIVLRTDLSDNPNFAELLQRNREMILAAQKHQALPFEMLVEQLVAQRNLSFNPLVQILFGVQNNEHDVLEHNLEGRGEDNVPLLSDQPMTTRFDLKLDVFEQGEHLSLTWLFNQSLFEADSINRLACNFAQLLQSVVLNLEGEGEGKGAGECEGKAHKRCAQLPLLNSADRQLLLGQWHSYSHETPKHRFVHQMFEQHLGESGDEVAVIVDDHEYDFDRLNQKSNQLAHYLIAQGVKPDTLVALYCERNFDLIVALLAVLKAGGAYLPLDVQYPQERIGYLLEDSGAALVLCQSRLKDDLSSFELDTICFDSGEIKPQLAQMSDSNIAPESIGLHPSNLAYVIYTSGSTGKPKGVMNTHENLCDFLTQSIADFVPEHVVGAAVSSPLVFDATVGSLWVALCAGRYIELLPEGVFALDRLGDCLADDEEALLFKVTPSHLDAVAGKGEIQPNPMAKHVIVVAGEPLTGRTLDLWANELLPGSLFINEYGPTETTVGATICPIEHFNQADLVDGASVPIGRAFGDTSLYVLDADMQPACIGAIGELYIGGAGLARGYLKRPGLSGEKFVPNPFSEQAGERLYRTGDLVRFLPSGNIQFVGRVDHQVKIRGFRIELPEIQARLLQAEFVREAAVVVFDGDNGPQLVAYIVKNDEHKDEEQLELAAALKKQLALNLPEYMVPGSYVFLAELPLNVNGKLDRGALPPPGESDLHRQSYVAPQTELQVQLCQLWQQLLKLEQVGIEDNFFAIGGHSLLATRLISQVRKTFHFELSLHQLFANPTIALLSETIDAPGKTLVLPAVEPCDRSDNLPLSYAQQRLWFIDQLQPGDTLYNMPGHFVLEGEFDFTAFSRAADALIARHEVLRTHFATIDNEPCQVIKAQGQCPLRFHDLSGLDETDRAALLAEISHRQQHQGFDLSADIMLRLEVVKLSNERHGVFYNIHHIAADGWSLGIFQNELNSLYQAFAKAEENPLEPLTRQYADYAQWQRNWLKDETLKEQLTFWQDKLAGMPTVHGLPLDRARPARTAVAGKFYHQTFSNELSNKLLKLCSDEQVTLFMLFQSAVALLLGRYSNQSDIAMGTYVAGRSHADLENMIGFFVNTLVIRTDVSGNDNFSEYLKRNKRNILDAFAHQHVPFEMLVEKQQVQRHLNHNPLVQVSLTVQNNEQGIFAQNQSAEHNQVIDGVTVKLDLELFVIERDGQLSLLWGYQSALFDDATVSGWADSLQTLFETALANPSQSIQTLDLLSDGQRALMLAETDKTLLQIQQQQNLITLFEAQVAQVPSMVAVEFQQDGLTYAELNVRANQLAHALIAKGVTKGHRVGLYIEPSLNMLPALLAVLKAGGAYVPLDSKLPDNRLAHMIDDAALEIVLVEGELARLDSVLSGLNAQSTVLLDVSVDSKTTQDFPKTNPQVALSGVDNAYLIYTSGSTGLPKGVQINHSNLSYYLNHAVEHYYKEAKAALVSTSLSFDATVTSLLAPLVCGAKVVLSSDDNQTAQLQNALFESEQPLVFKLTPAHLQLVSQQLGGEQQTSSQPHCLVIGGEQLQSSILAQFALRLPNATFVNEYGPTEATVGCIGYTVEPSLETLPQSAAVPIGQAFDYVECYVLDSQMQLQLPGAVGELYIGGPGLSSGYLNREALTAERFVTHPFSSEPGSRLYRTGDLVRKLNDGNLMFVGRADFQLKLRGLRIEPGEIEQQLRQLEGVDNCVVTLAGEQQILVAYVSLTVQLQQDNVDEQQLTGQFKQALALNLPEYMVPQVMVVVPEFKLSVNGKIDRNALPVVDIANIRKNAYVAPQTKAQQTLCGLYQQVLKLEQVGIEDSFFELGGHSLLAARLINLLRAEFHCELPLRQLFETPTISGLSKHIEDDIEPCLTLPALERLPQNTTPPLSFAQQRLWFLDQLSQQGVQFNMTERLLLRGKLNHSAFEQTISTLLQRHQVLRTCFAAKDDKPYPVIQQDHRLPLQYHDFSALSQADAVAEVKRLVDLEQHSAFDLSQDLMLRFEVAQLPDEQLLILYTLHHIAGDGWSSSILSDEISQLYRAYCQQQDNPLPELAVQYGDFAHWQQQWLKGELLEQGLDYWQQKLKGMPLLHSLPLDKPRPQRQSYQGSSVHQQLGVQLSGQIERFNQDNQSTLFMFMHLLLSVLLYRNGGERDIVIGTTVAGRNHQHLESMIGLFVNDLVLRAELDGESSFAQMLEQHRNTVLDGFAHQHIPFEMLVEHINPKRSLSHGPLFQIKLDVHNNPQAEQGLESLELIGSQSASTPGQSVGKSVGKSAGQHAVKHDLYLSISPSENGLQLSWRYNHQLFEAYTIERLSRQFEVLLEEVLANPQKPLDLLNLQDAQQQQMLLQHGQGGKSGPAETALLHQLFESNAAQFPERIALYVEDNAKSYEQLNQQANQLAHYLIAQGIKPDDLVGLCAERSAFMVVAMLAVIKAGGAYVPLDPNYPKARLDDIIADSGCALVLCQQHLATTFEFDLPQLVMPDSADLKRKIAQMPSHNPDSEALGLSGNNLIYVLYTSGSTGKPKGVMVEHYALTQFCLDTTERYYTKDLNGSVVATSFGFDLTVPAFYLPLINGGAVSLLPQGNELASLAVQIEDELKPSLLRLTPSHVQGLLALLTQPSYSQAHLFVLGGEALTFGIARALAQRFPNARIYNQYGPAETVVACSLHRVDSNTKQPLSAFCPIGQPLAENQLLVLDENQQLCPPGVAGELYIAADTLARGYLNLDDQNKARFIPNPFAKDSNGRMYRSGDRVRWLLDKNGELGELAFIERLDNQVKIRGLRIELGEIEQQLSALDGIAQCAVTADSRLSGNTEQQLVAYVVASQTLHDEAEFKRQLQQQLAAVLPDYMVPGVYLLLDKLPLSVNGKVDKRALPSPTQADLLTVDYVAPRNQGQEKLCQLFAELLNLTKVGIADNFFELGGHSLLATQLVNRIRQQFDCELPLHLVFANPTVEALAAHLKSPAQLTLQPMTKVPEHPLSFAQQRLWFINQLDGQSRQFNVPGRLMFDGQFNREAFELAVQGILLRHEVLRTSFVEVAGEAQSQLKQTFELPLQYHDLSDLPQREKAQAAMQLANDEAAALFDLSEDLMLRLRLVKLSDEQHLVLFTVHHIASDGWSLVILRNELKALYDAFSHNRANPLPPLKLQYGDFAHWQRQWLHGQVVEHSLDYWRNQLKDLPILHGLMLDKPRPAQQRFIGQACQLQLDSRLTAAVNAFNRRHQTTLFMLMHTALAVLIGRHSAEQDIVIGTSTAGRAHKDVEGLIGFFINDLVIRTQLQPEQRFSQLLSQQRQVILDGYEHQHIPFEMLVEALNPQRSLSHGPLFQIKLDVQNYRDDVVSIEPASIDGVITENVSIKHDLYVSVIESEEGILMSWRYDSDLFHHATIAGFTRQFKTLLEGIVSAPELAVERLPLLSAQEQQALLTQGTTRAMPNCNANLIDQFEAQVDRTPDAQACIFAEHSLSYSELNQSVNKLAHYLIAQGAGPETVVGVSLERSQHLLVSLLAVMKSGAAYVALDPNLPQNRLEMMTDDCACVTVLTEDNCQNGQLGSYSDANPIVERSELHLAYILYTSGSTGKPKGVEVAHQALSSYLNHAIEHYYHEDLRGSWVATAFNFDLTIPTLYLPLLKGGCVSMLAPETEISQLAQRLSHQGETLKPQLLRLTPTHIQAILSELEQTARAHQLNPCAHVFIIGGEALAVSQVKQLKQYLPNARVYNHYGPTEAVVGCSLYPLDDLAQLAESHYCPIGKPMGNRRLLVLDEQLQLVPAGMPGQLYIGEGDSEVSSLARGYLNEPELSEEKFIIDPFSDVSGKRLYQTGDVVRMLPDGNLEFVDRVDNQVKLRGLRIELGEIEQALVQLDEVENAAVVVSGDDKSQQQLVAYVVLTESGSQDEQQLNKALRQKLALQLADYMVPRLYVLLPELPQTQNGKLDRKALLSIVPEDLNQSRYVAPQNEVESQLCELWQQMLKVDRVGINDDFFLLGGHSLLATRLISAIRATFEIELSVRVLFEHSTISALAVEVMVQLYDKQSKQNEQELDMSDDIDEVVLE